MRVLVLLVAMGIGLVVGQESNCELMPPVEASMLKPGLRLAVEAFVIVPPMSALLSQPLFPDQDGLSQVLYHYSINKPVPGVSAGDYSEIVTSATDGYFAYDNAEVEVKIGDTVNGWYQTIINGEGRDCLEQSWVVADDTTTTEAPTTTTVPTTTTTTTPPETPDETDPATTTTTPGATGNTPPPSGTDARKKARGKKYCDVYPCTVPEPVQPECTEFPCLVFSDEFDFLDMQKWEHELTLGGGGNWEFQQYCNNRSNSYVRDGVLYIKPTLTEERYGVEFLSTGTMDIHGTHPANLCTGGAWYGCLRVGNPDNILNPIQSARLRTSKSFYTRYGRVETRARMPAGDWIWPAIWMLPRYEEYGMWPASGEIDIVETRGNADLRDEQGNQRGNTHGGATIHWGPFFEGNRYELTMGEFTSDLAENFHDYAVEWNDNSMVFEFDGEEVLRVEPPAGGFWEMGNYEEDFPGIQNPWVNGDLMAPFDAEFYIILNVAVGGTMGFFPDGWTNAGYQKPWINDSPHAPRDFQNAKDLWYPTWNPDENNGESAAMAVDYIRVYKMSADDMN